MESREVWTAGNIDWLEGKEKWKDLAGIILYRSKRAVNGRATIDTHYYISSRALNAEGAARIIRWHWSIENNLHWFLDVYFGEDRCRARKGHEAENLNILRKMALYLLSVTPVSEKRLSKRLKILRAALNDNFLHQALFGKSK